MGYEPSPLDWELIRQWGLTFVPNRDLNGYLVWGLADTLDLYPRWEVASVELAGSGLWVHCIDADGNPATGKWVACSTMRIRMDQTTDDQGNTQFWVGDDQPAQVFIRDYETPAGPNGVASEIVTGLPVPGSSFVTFKQSLTAVTTEPLRVGAYFFSWFEEPIATDPFIVYHPLANPYITTGWMERDFNQARAAGIDFMLHDYPFTESQNPKLAEMVSAAQATGMKLALFLDCNPLFVADGWRDLMNPNNRKHFGDVICAWFAAVPRANWLTLQGRPVISLYANPFGPSDLFQQLVREVKGQFNLQFGISPVVLTDSSWGKIAARSDLGSDGYLDYGISDQSFTYFGPITSACTGYNDPSRPENPVIPRDPAAFRATLHGAPAGTIFFINTSWNELKEASGVLPTLEYGQMYLDIISEEKAEYLNPTEGTDSMRLDSVTFAPTTIQPGEDVTVTAVLTNNGTNIANMQAPNPGTEYVHPTSYKENGYGEVYKAWRIGVDYEGRDNVKYPDHPYRWGFGKNLAPGASVTVTGKIRFPLTGTYQLWLGVVHEQVAAGWVIDNQGTTVITVSAIVQPPTVTFTATPPTIKAGESATLAWDCQNVTSVYLDNAPVVGVFSQTVSPSATRTYDLKVIFPDGSENHYYATVTVTPVVEPPTDRNPFVWDTPAPWLGFQDGPDFIVKTVYAYDEPKAQGRDVVYVRVEDADGHLIDWQQVDFCNGGIASDWTINGLVNFTMYEGAIFDPNGPNPRGPHTVKCGGAFVDGIGLPVHRHWQYLCVFQKVGVSLKQQMKVWADA